MSHIDHQKRSPRVVSCAILTISDTRTPETDTGGQLIRQLLEEGGHSVAAYAIVPDEPGRIREHVERFGVRDDVQAVILTGGTGIAPRDQTYETVAPMLEKRLDGFGEIFRMLSFEEIGPAAMLSRAIAGTYGRRIVFCLPGSPNAIRLAMTRLIVPEIGHLVYEASK